MGSRTDESVTKTGTSIHRSTRAFALFMCMGIGALAGCAADPEEAEGTDESALIGRTTSEICGAVDPRWGDGWQLPDDTGDKRAHATDAFACANRLYWSTRFASPAVHTKFYLHRKICTANPASHYAMNDEQARFYCSLSLHFRMCNTQGLYALKDVPDSEPRRAREREIFSECLKVSGELPHFRTGLRMAHASDAEVAGAVERLYNEYKVEPGVRVAPAIVNPERKEHELLEKLVRTAYYGITVPLEMLETAFSRVFFSLDPFESQSQIELIARYRRHLMNVDGRNLLHTSDLPICGDGQTQPGEECDDGNTRSGDGCSAICVNE